MKNYTLPLFYRVLIALSGMLITLTVICVIFILALQCRFVEYTANPGYILAAVICDRP